MKKYCIVQVTGNTNTLLEVVNARSVNEARRQAVRSYINIVTSGTSKLAVVSEAAYNQYYR